MPCLHLALAPGWMHRIAAASSAGCLVLPLRVDVTGPGGGFRRQYDRLRILGLGLKHGMDRDATEMFQDNPGLASLYAVAQLQPQDQGALVGAGTRYLATASLASQSQHPGESSNEAVTAAWAGVKKMLWGLVSRAATADTAVAMAALHLSDTRHINPESVIA